MSESPSDRELDAECARIIGCQVICMCDNKAHGRGGILKPYSTSLDACRELLEWACNIPGNLRFLVERMIDNFDPNFDENSMLETYEMMKKFLLATPRQIAEAFVETFGGRNDIHS